MSELDPILEEFRQLEEDFELEPAPEEIVVESKEIIEAPSTEIIEAEEFEDKLVKDRREDYDYARTNIKLAIEAGNDALEDLLSIAKSSEQPRAFEVVSNLVKTIVDSNEKLMDMSKKIDELEVAGAPLKIDEKPVQQQNNQTNIFVGSTADLQEIIKQTSNKLIDIPVIKEDE